MDDYISREAALDFHIQTYDLNISVQDERILGDRFEEFLKSIPAADVVEVVRCKDCINWNGNDCVTMYGLYAPRPNDYCSRGEKNRG